MTDEQTKACIAANLKRLRGSLSLAEVARRSDSFPTTIKEIEEGVRMPGVGLLTRIAAAFGVTVDEFLRNPTKPKKTA